MPLPPNANSNETEDVERLLTSKFQPVMKDTFNLYVDSVDGNDQWPGTGASDAPYLTIMRAVRDASTYSLREVTRINLSGAADHEIIEDYIFPSTGNSDLQGTDTSQDMGMRATGPLILQAEPVLEQTITALQIVSQVADTTSALRLLTTSLTFTVNEFAGLWLVDSTGIVARILSNTADVGAGVIVVANTVTLTGPVLIYSAGATIVPEDPTSAIPTLYFRGSAMVMLQGVNVEASTGGSVKVDRGQELVAIACQLDKVILGEDDAQSEGFLNLQACLLGDYELNAGGLRLFNSVTDDNVVSGVVSGFLRGVRADAVACYFNSMSNSSSLFSDGVFSASVVSLQNCEVLDAPTSGILQNGGQLFCEAVKVVGAGSRGIFVTGNALAILGIVSGANDTNGLVCQSGGVAAVTSNTTITGAANADFIVDGLPSISSANFHAMAAPVAMKGPLSGIIQGTDTGFGRRAASILTTTPLTISNAHEFVFEDATAGAKSVLLPALAQARGKLIFIAKSDTSANAVTVTPNGAETIQGAASVVLAAQFQAVWLVAPDSGTDWQVVAAGTPSGGGAIVISGALFGHSVTKVVGDSPYTPLSTDYIIRCDTSGGAITVALPAIAGLRNRILKISKVTSDVNAVTIDPNAAETINGAATLVLGARSSAEIYAPPAGTDWDVM